MHEGVATGNALDPHEKAPVGFAATRLAASWKGALARRGGAHRRVSVIALLASVDVARQRRRGLVQFLAYAGYVCLLGYVALRLSDQDVAFQMERKMYDLWDAPALVPKRAHVNNVEQLWDYIGELHAMLYGEGQTARNRLALPGVCPFTQRGVTSPCANAVCASLVATGALAGPGASACLVVVAAHCAAFGSIEPACAQFKLSCSFEVDAPTNPCLNPLCAATATDGEYATAAVSDACDAIVGAHCAAYPAEAGCAESNSTARRRALAERSPVAPPAAGGRRQLRESARANDALLGMLDGSNRIIGGLFVWHSRYKTVACPQFGSYIRACHAEGGESSREPFVGAATGVTYRPGTFDYGGDEAFRFDTAVPAGTSIAETPLTELWMLPLDLGMFPDSSRAGASATLAYTRADGWLSQAARKVVIALNVYNGNLKRYASATLVFEFTPGGSVRSSRSVSSVAAAANGVDSRLLVAALVLVALDMLLICGRLLERLLAVHQRAHLALFGSLSRARLWLAAARRRAWRAVRAPAAASGSLSPSKWSRSASSRFGSAISWASALRAESASARSLWLADQAARSSSWLAVEVAYAALACTYVLLLVATRELSARTNLNFAAVAAGADASTITDAYLATSVRQIFLVFDAASLSKAMGYVASLAALLLLLRMFKYCLFHRRLSTISTVLGNAATDLLHFGALFVLITASFALAASLLFGRLQERFNGVPRSAQTLCLLLVDEFSYEHYTAVIDQPELGALFFWLYILISYLLMLNVLLALIIDAFALAKTDALDEPSLASIALDVALHAAYDVADLGGELLRRASFPSHVAAPGAAAKHAPGADAQRKRPSLVAPLSGRSRAPQKALPAAASGAAHRRLSSAHARALIEQLAQRASTSSDVVLARAVARNKARLIAQGTQLSLKQLTEVLGAVGATRVMYRFGAAAVDASAAAAGARAVDQSDVLLRTLMRVSRGVDRINEQRHATHHLDQHGGGSRRRSGTPHAAAARPPSEPSSGATDAAEGHIPSAWTATSA